MEMAAKRSRNSSFGSSSKQEEEGLARPPELPPRTTRSTQQHQLQQQQQIRQRVASLRRHLQERKRHHLSSVDAAAPKTTTRKLDTVHYSTFIISNAIEHRSLVKPDLMPELQLQKVAKSVYGSILLAMLNARSAAAQSQQQIHGKLGGETSANNDENYEDDVYLRGLEDSGSSSILYVFPESVSMLVESLEHLLKMATAQHRLLSNLDLHAVLSLWHELNLTMLSLTASGGGESSSSQLVLSSEECYAVVVEFLLRETSLSPALWQLSLLNLLTHLRHKRGKEEVGTSYEKLLAVLVRFFQQQQHSVGDEGGGGCGDQEGGGAGGGRCAVMMTGLVEEMVAILSGAGEDIVFVVGRSDGVLSGTWLLLEVLMESLKNR